MPLFCTFKKYFLRSRKEKSLAHVQDFEGRIKFGSRKNSISFNRDLFIFKVLLYAWNHGDEKEDTVMDGLCSLGINNLVNEKDPIITEAGAIIPASGRFSRCCSKQGKMRTPGGSAVIIYSWETEEGRSPRILLLVLGVSHVFLSFFFFGSSLLN